MLIRERFGQLVKEARERWQAAATQINLKPARILIAGACALLFLVVLPLTCSIGVRRDNAHKAAQAEERQQPQTRVVGREVTGERERQADEAEQRWQVQRQQRLAQRQQQEAERQRQADEAEEKWQATSHEHSNNALSYAIVHSCYLWLPIFLAVLVLYTLVNSSYVFIAAGKTLVFLVFSFSVVLLAHKFIPALHDWEELTTLARLTKDFAKGSHLPTDPAVWMGASIAAGIVIETLARVGRERKIVVNIKK